MRQESRPSPRNPRTERLQSNDAHGVTDRVAPCVVLRVQSREVHVRSRLPTMLEHTRHADFRRTLRYVNPTG
jgi:hypothetical protein